jgi:hypothetical protein
VRKFRNGDAGRPSAACIVPDANSTRIVVAQEAGSRNLIRHLPLPPVLALAAFRGKRRTEVFNSIAGKLDKNTIGARPEISDRVRLRNED